MIRFAAVFVLMCAVFGSGCSRRVAGPSFGEEPIVRALVFENAGKLAVNVSDSGSARGDADATRFTAGAVLVARNEGGEVVMRRQGSTQVIARGPVVSVAMDNFAGLVTLHDESTDTAPADSLTYEGVLEIRPVGMDTVNAIIALPIEEYLRGVVPYEIGVTSPFEAMKAQAVAARSETVTALTERTYAGPGYDICSDVNCQVFRGTQRRTDDTDRAIRETRGIILTYDGKPIPAYYSANSGGHTEDILNVWPGRDRGIPVWAGVLDGARRDYPGDLRVESNARQWILSRPNVYSNRDFQPGIPAWTEAGFRWEAIHSAEDLSRAVARTRDIGRVVRIETDERGPSGRLKTVRFVGERGELEAGPELAIRRTFNPALRSSAFVVEPVGNPNRPDAFVIRGAGFGHGVGMCQVGAMGRALSGQDYARILLHYYVGTELTRAYE